MRAWIFLLAFVVTASGCVSGTSTHPGATGAGVIPVPKIVQGGPGPAQWVAFGPSQVPGDPFAIVSGSDNNIWFSENAGNSVDRLAMRTNRVTRFAIPTKNADVSALAVGPDKDIWFTEPGAGKIGTLQANGTIVEYSLPSGASPFDIKSGPDGNLWFTDDARKAIGRITTTGSVTEFTTPSGNPPQQLTVGSDGNLWFTEGSPLIGRVTTSGVITEFQTHATTETSGITLASDGNVWFGEFFDHKLGRITPSGTVTEFYAHGRHPEALANGGSRFELFVMVDEGLARYNIQSHKFTVLGNAPNFPGVGPLTIGPDGNVWFTQPQFGTMSVFVRNVLTVTPTSLALQVGQSGTLTASEPTASAPLLAKSSNAAVATVSPAGSGTFTVTATGAGSCTVTVSDHKGNSFPVPVTVQ